LSNLKPAPPPADNTKVIAPPPPPPLAPQLSAEHLLDLQRARTALRKVRRAISVASFDGWTIGAFAALTLLFGLNSLSSVSIGLARGAIAYVELRGASQLRRLDPRAARTLGFNQLALGMVLIVYALWRTFSILRYGSGAYDVVSASDPQMAQMLQPVENLTRLISLAIYAALIVIGVFAQGGLALFYFTRAKHIEAYLAQTPAWIVAMQKAGLSF
jgi:hypothetical protein